MSKIKLTGSNSGYVEISSAADAGNLTLNLPTSGTALLSNADNVFSGITTFTGLNITDDVTFNGGSYDVLWDASDNQLEFGDNAKLSFGASSDLQLYHDGNHSYIHDTGTGTLRVQSSQMNVIKADGSETMAIFVADAEVGLFFNNSKKIETTNTGAVVTGICTATSFSGSGEGLTRTTQLSHRNIIINGDFKIAQRATSHNSSGYRTVDRFQMTAGGASHTLTQAQVDVASGTTPYTEGFRKAYSITNAGQNANNQAYLYMRYNVEAQDLATSGWNYTSSSSFITISFWIKASVTQTYLFFLHTNDGGTKEYNHLMSLSANTWTKITLNVPGNSGLQFDNDNGLGLSIYWTAYLGDHYTSTGSVDQWVTHAGYTSRPDMGSTWWTTSNATFQLTGVQLEVGSVATPFEHRSYGEELSRCQRYFQVLSRNTSAGLNAHSRYPALGNGTNSTLWYCYHKQTMRVRPSLVTSNITSTTVEIFNYSTSGGATYGGSSMSEGDENHSQITVTTTGGVSTGNVACWRFSVNGDCYWAVDSEL